MILLSIALAGSLAFALPEDPAPAAEVAALELLDSQALHAALESLTREHPTLASWSEIGRSRAGRPIHALRIAAGELVAGRPAILVVANLDGPDVWTSSLALHHARALLAAHGSDERTTSLLERTTLYFVARANPDAAQARFERPLRERLATGPGFDDDRDGRNGEDEAADVNGDGFVGTMRVLDPEGEWVEDPSEPRVLVRAERKKGERGRWKLVPEGRDADGDGEVGEDPLLDARVNRNFAHAWKEHAPESGRYPTSEPEARALADFVIAHPEVALVLTYGAQGNLVGKPDEMARGRRGEETMGWAKEDAELVAELGRRYREATESKIEGAKEEAGSFQAWCHHHRGLWTLNVAPWAVPKEAGKKGGERKAEKGEKAEGAPAGEASGKAPEAVGLETQEAGPAPAETAAQPAKPKEEEREPSADARALRWLEEQGVAPAFLVWTPFDHPELGAVEIGGFAPYALIEPPAARFAELAAKHHDFLLGLADVLPRVELREARAKRLADELYEVRVALENDALLPLRSRAAVAARTLRPVRVRLELGAGGVLVAGPRQELVSELEGAGGRRELRWLVRTADPAGLRILTDSDHAGAFSVRPEVER